MVGWRGMSDLVAAAVQMTSTDDVGRNLERAAELVGLAAAQGAALVGLPENFAYLGGDQDHRLALAEHVPAPETAESAGAAPAAPASPDGPMLAQMREIARRSGVWLILGGFPERGPAGRLRNSCVLLNPAG